MCRIILVLLCCFVFQYSKGFSVIDTLPDSQKINVKSYLLKLGIATGRFAVRDNETSPLTYKGIIPGLQVGALFYGKNSITFFDFSFSYGKLVTRNYPEIDNNKASAYNNNLNIGYGRLVKFRKAPKSSFYVGANIGSIVNMRNNQKFNNANFNYEGFASFGPIFIWEKTNEFRSCKENQNDRLQSERYPSIKWSASLFLPIVSGVARPPYPAITDFVDNNSLDFTLSRLKIVSFNKLVCPQFTSSACYNFRNGNGFKLSYNWYYYNYYPAKYKVSGVAGTFTFSFLFYLNKK